MTAGNTSAFVEFTPSRRPDVHPRIPIAGTAWPCYKVHAVVAALVVAIAVMVLAGTAQAAAWASGVTLLAVWWGERTVLPAIAPRR